MKKHESRLLAIFLRIMERLNWNIYHHISLINCVLLRQKRRKYQNGWPFFNAMTGLCGLRSLQ